MSKNRNPKFPMVFSKNPAKKITAAAAALTASIGNPPARPVPVASRTTAPDELHPVCPNPTGHFEPLTNLAVIQLTQLTMHWMDEICRQRRSVVDFKYWESCTREILSISDPTEVVLVPARAGAGKSTWTLAFLLALCDLFVRGDPLGTAVGGVLLVVQKVETLNEIADAIGQHFPDYADTLMAALQGWTQSGSERGFCRNPQVTSFEQCKRDRCRYAVTCKVIQSGQQAGAAFVIGMTQARFALLRDAGDFEAYLVRQTADGDVQRRFLIFDEKFDFAPATELDQKTLNAASDCFEALAIENNLSDSSIRRLQTNLTYQAGRPFQRLRRETVFEDGKDQPFGLCSLETQDSTEAEAFREYRDSFEEGYRRSYRSKPLLECLDVVGALYRGQCLFCKSGGTFHILHAGPPEIQFGETQTIVFDATAEVDGDYQHLPNVHWLPSSPARHMSRVTLHVYQHHALNVSRSAFNSSWRLPALAELTNEIVANYPGSTFLCTYKSLTQDLQELLSPETLDHLAFMPGTSGIPYFGGTNGSNRFHLCTNVILLGYPRLSPMTYLFRAYAVWHDSGLSNELLRLNDDLEALERNPRDVLRRIPSLAEYEARHLAARLEQEIYRCALRNHDCDEDLHIFLFSPPESVWALLQERFTSCRIEVIRELPPCISTQKLLNRTYNGTPTALSKFMTFLEQWDGTPFRPGELQEKLGISKSAWAELRKQSVFPQLLNNHHIVQTGRGRNAVFQSDTDRRAS